MVLPHEQDPVVLEPIIVTATKQSPPTPAGGDGSIPTASVYIGTEAGFPGLGQDESRSSSFVFNKDDATFLSFTHSIGWTEGAMSHYTLEVVDPGERFELEFLESAYLNRNANQTKASKNYWITYGHGKNMGNWSPSQLMYLIRVEVDILTSGARKYILQFGSKPSLRNRPSKEGWPLVDSWGRRLLTAAKVGFNADKAKSIFNNMEDMDGKFQDAVSFTEWISFGYIGADWLRGAAAGTARGLDAMGALWGQKGLGGDLLGLYGDNPGMADLEVLALDSSRVLGDPTWDPHSMKLPAMKDTAAETFIQFLDEAVNLTIQRYIENITGYKNVIVLLPSFKYTIVARWLYLILAGPWNKSNNYFSIRNSPDHLINHYLFKSFSNLHCFPNYAVGSQDNEQRAADGDVLASHIENTRLIEANSSSKRNLWLKNPPRKTDNLFIYFQASNNDFVENTSTGQVEGVDWMKPLKQFGDELSKTIQADVMGSFRKAQGIGSLNDAKNFGTFDWMEVENETDLWILKKHGAIDTDKERCFIWGEEMMVSLFLGRLPMGKPGSKARVAYSQVKGTFPSGKPLSVAGSPMVTKNKLGRIRSFVNNKQAREDLNDSLRIKPPGTHISDLESYVKTWSSDQKKVLDEDDTHHWLDLGGGQMVPILRSGVVNSNVLDARIQINPHYWANLINTADGISDIFYRNELVTKKPLLEGISEDMYKAAGVDPNDKGFKKWVEAIENAIIGYSLEKEVTNYNVLQDVEIDKHLYNIQMLIAALEYPSSWVRNRSPEEVEESVQEALRTSRGTRSNPPKPAEYSKQSLFEPTPGTLGPLSPEEEDKRRNINEEERKKTEEFNRKNKAFRTKLQKQDEDQLSLSLTEKAKAPILLSEKEKFIAQVVASVSTGLVESKEGEYDAAKIINKLSTEEAKFNKFQHTQLFYEKLYQLAGPQLDVTSYPLFRFASMADISRPMFVYMKQPTILKGISDKEEDVLSINRRRERQYATLGTGFYYLRAFEHRISKSTVDSRFRLVKNPYQADAQELEAYAASIDRARSLIINKKPEEIEAMRQRDPDNLDYKLATGSKEFIRPRGSFLNRVGNLDGKKF